MSRFMIGPIDPKTPGTGYFANGEMDRSMPSPKRIQLQNPFAAVDVQVANVLNGLCEWTIPLRIYGQGGTAALAAADMAAKISALNAVLTADPNPWTIIDSLDYDGAPETVFQMLKSPPIMPARKEFTEKRRFYDAKVVVYTNPTGHTGSPTAIVLTPDTVTRVALFPLFSTTGSPPLAVPLGGDAPAALIVTVAHTGGGLNDVICAIAPPGAELDDYDTGMTGSGGPGQIAAATITAVGRMRVLATLASSGSGTRVGIGQDGASAPHSTVALLSSDPTLVDLGEFTSTGSTELQVFVTAGSAVLTHLVCVPVDVSCVSAFALGDAAEVVFENDANSHPGQVIGNGLVAPLQAPSLLVVLDPADVEATVSVSYTAQWWGWAY